MKFFYDVDIPSDKLDKAKKRLSKAEQERQELEDQIKKSEELALERRNSKLQESSEVLKKFDILSKFYNNIELNQAVISLQFIHNIFVEHVEYDINLLTQIHQYYSDTTLHLLEKNKSQFDKKIQMLNTQKKQFITELDMLKQSLKQHDKTVFNVNQTQFKIEYTETLIRMFKLLVYSITNNVNDHRLGNNFKYKSFTAFTRILIYDIKDTELSYKLSDVLVEPRMLLEHKGFYITQETIDLLLSNHYDLTYLATFTLNDTEIEIINVGANNDYSNVIFFEVNTMKIYSVKSPDLINRIIDEKNTAGYVIRQKIDEITRKIARIDIDLSSRLSLKPEVVDAINRFNEKLQSIEIINKDENLDLEIGQLNALLNIDIQ